MLRVQGCFFMSHYAYPPLGLGNLWYSGLARMRALMKSPSSFRLLYLVSFGTARAPQASVRTPERSMCAKR